ncbi:hypothetical protein MUK42_34814 [Musa troglodytarum]|uniref:Late embryogenesis abundant protein LEA-2 subgroup domain-containing protein n=1 Tax=Musa troglodytarum TaxID=320322 RepID=A0A9E7EEB8_9LILI|nr:hypothetical protein MUK42_34814 [Musa troglodytarum]
MSVRNPSRGMGFSYEAGGRAAITHGTVEITAGMTPVFFQGHVNTTSIRLVLRGSNALLPKEIGRSVKGSKNAVDLSLMATLTVSPRVGGLGMWALSMDVTSDVQVIGMVKQAQISSQHCNTALAVTKDFGSSSSSFSSSSLSFDSSLGLEHSTVACT